MEKGDKPKPKDKKPKEKKPKAKKVIKQKQTQKQTQDVKQSVKIVLAETKPKAKRTYAKKTQIVRQPVNIVRGQTVVSYLGAEGDLNQVMTAPRTQVQPQPIVMQKPPPKQPPLLTQIEAPATIDTELTAVSEFVPIARTPAFEEIKKKVVAKKKKPIVVQIGEGIGDFIKQNLLDQKPDFQLQEPSRKIEETRTPITIKPDEPPKAPKKKKGKFDVPVDIYVPPMKFEVAPEPETITVKPEKKPVKKERKQRPGKFDVPIEIITKESKMQDINAPEQVDEKPKEAISSSFQDDPMYEQMLLIEQDPSYQEAIRKIEQEKTKREMQREKERVEKDKEAIKTVKEYMAQQREKAEAEYEEKGMGKEDINQEGVFNIQDLTGEEREESKRRLIVADTIEDIMQSIDEPVFSLTPDFRAISQEVEVDNAPPEMTDYGDRDIEQFNVDGFVPVGEVRGIEEATTAGGGSPRGRRRKYTPEQAKIMKVYQTKYSNRRQREKQKTERGQMGQEDFNAYDADFTSGDFQQQQGDLLRGSNYSRADDLDLEGSSYAISQTPISNRLFNPDALDSGMPFLGFDNLTEDIEFI